jgi:LuxR family transcriptional regulator
LLQAPRELSAPFQTVGYAALLYGYWPQLCRFRLVTAIACVGNDELFADAPQLWDGARDHGLRRGITQCLMLPNHALGFLSVSSTHPGNNRVSNEELELRLQMLVQMALTTLLRLEHEMVMPPEMKFSKREKEILKWTAEGKTSAEIAIILSISENTVNFHQKNMQKKFNAPNKTQIACYAAATGII